MILLAVTDEGYGIWDDNVWVDYDGEIESAEEDITLGARRRAIRSDHHD